MSETSLIVFERECVLIFVSTRSFPLFELFFFGGGRCWLALNMLNPSSFWHGDSTSMPIYFSFFRYRVFAGSLILLFLKVLCICYFND